MDLGLKGFAHLVRRKRWLTPDERARVADYRKRWMALGFSTEPADRDAARRAIESLYAGAGLNRPRVVWCDSPMSMVLTASLALSPDAYRAWYGLKPLQDARVVVRRSIRDSVETSLELSIGEARRAAQWKPFAGPRVPEVWRAVHEAFRQSARQSLSAALTARVEDWVVESARRSLALGPVFHRTRTWLWRAIGTAFVPYTRHDALVHPGPDHGAAGLQTAVRRAVTSQVPLCGQHNADWLGLCDYLHDVCGLRQKRALESNYGLLAASAGWLLPHANICWVSERPSAVSRDDAGLLHSASGPAIVYRDGWEGSFWHGVHVERYWLAEARQYDPRFIATFRDGDQRRALAEIAGGWTALIARGHPVIVDSDKDPTIGTLLEWRGPRGVARFLKVECGTGRTFVLPVPEHCRTARDANAWTYGLTAAEYSPEIRT